MARIETSLSTPPQRTALILTTTAFDGDPRHTDWAESLEDLGFLVQGWEFLGTRSVPTSIRDGGRAAFIAESRVQAGFPLVALQASLAFAESWVLEHEDESAPLSPWLLELLRDVSSGKTSVTHDYISKQTLRIAAAVATVGSGIGFELVVANDLPAAVAAAAVWGATTTQVVYDAQEIFTDMYDFSPSGPLTSQERAKWVGLETTVCQEVAQVITVSPGIADLYSSRHSANAAVIPNFTRIPSESRHAASDPLHSATTAGPVRFVYMGHVQAGRGIDSMIKNWVIPSDRASLSLYTPEGALSSKLRATVRSHCAANPEVAIRFESPVPTSEMILALRNYDVGVLPYDYPFPYNNCSPNKLGQYMTAGLALLANDQPFITSVVMEQKVGEIFRWSVPGSFTEASTRLTNRAWVEDLKAKSLDAAKGACTWNAHFDSWWSDWEMAPTVSSATRGAQGSWPPPISRDFEVRIAATTRNQVGSLAQRMADRIGLTQDDRYRAAYMRLVRVPVLGKFAERVARRVL